MESMNELQREIEIARKKLDNAIGKGYSEKECYGLSLELDRLIELYIAREEHEDVPVV